MSPVSEKIKLKNKQEKKTFTVLFFFKNIFVPREWQCHESSFLDYCIHHDK